MRKLLGLGQAVATVLVLAGAVHAQCGFQHPRTTREMVLPLVQAYVPCEVDAACVVDGVTRPSNATTEAVVPGCQAPATYNEYAGSPSNGWLWGPDSIGTVAFKAVKNRVVHPSNPPNTADVAVHVDLKGVEDALGPAEGFGHLSPRRRTTFQDRANGDMTVIDLEFPGFPVHVVDGRAKLRTTANVWLNSGGFSGAPGCTALELVGFELRDENDTPFASPGIFMPAVAN